MLKSLMLTPQVAKKNALMRKNHALDREETALTHQNHSPLAMLLQCSFTWLQLRQGS